MVSHQSVSSLTTWNKSLSQLWIHSSLPNRSSHSYWIYSYRCWPDCEPMTTADRNWLSLKLVTTSDGSLSQLPTPFLPRFPHPPPSFPSDCLWILIQPHSHLKKLWWAWKVEKAETQSKFMLLLPPPLLFKATDLSFSVPWNPNISFVIN